jgi:hypothetical protein
MAEAEERQANAQQAVAAAAAVMAAGRTAAEVVDNSTLEGPMVRISQTVSSPDGVEMFTKVLEMSLERDDRSISVVEAGVGKVLAKRLLDCAERWKEKMEEGVPSGTSMSMPEGLYLELADLSKVLHESVHAQQFYSLLCMMKACSMYAATLETEIIRQKDKIFHLESDLKRNVRQKSD